MRRRMVSSIILAVIGVLLFPLQAFALNYGIGLQDGEATVRGTYAMNYVMVTQPSATHINSVYVRKDAFNIMEVGWSWWGPNNVYGGYTGGFNDPDWFVHIQDGSSNYCTEWTSHGKYVINSSYPNGRFFYGTEPLPGYPTPGTSYGFKAENRGYNSYTFDAKYNNYVKKTWTFTNMTYGKSVIGSERASLADSNYAHFWSCQDIINQPSQPWTNWVAPKEVTFAPGDSDYYWRNPSATEHFCEHR